MDKIIMFIVFAIIGVLILIVLSSNKLLKALFTVVSGLLLIVFAAFAGVMFSAGRTKVKYAWPTTFLINESALLSEGAFIISNLLRDQFPAWWDLAPAFLLFFVGSWEHPCPWVDVHSAGFLFLRLTCFHCYRLLVYPSAMVASSLWSVLPFSYWSILLNLVYKHANPRQTE